MPDMTESLLYLSSRDIEKIGLGPAELVDAVERVFAAQAGGAARPGPKAVVPVAVGHSFHAMPGTIAADGLAGMKFFGVVPDNAERGLPNVCSLVALSDIANALPLCIMDGGWITGVRTAAMTAVAARHLAHPDSETAAFIGYGVQARAHARLLRQALPRLQRAAVLGRGASRRDAFVRELQEAGWEVRLASGPDNVLAEADVAVSTVPEHPGWAAFLDPALLPPRSIAARSNWGSGCGCRASAALPARGERESGGLRLCDRRRPGRHDVRDAVIGAVVAAQDEVGAGELLRPDGVLDDLRAAPHVA
jgi:alanine dehydrogenase